MDTTNPVLKWTQSIAPHIIPLLLVPSGLSVSFRSQILHRSKIEARRFLEALWARRESPGEGNFDLLDLEG